MAGAVGQHLENAPLLDRHAFLPQPRLKLTVYLAVRLRKQIGEMLCNGVRSSRLIWPRIQLLINESSAWIPCLYATDLLNIQYFLYRIDFRAIFDCAELWCGGPRCRRAGMEASVSAFVRGAEAVGSPILPSMLLDQTFGGPFPFSMRRPPSFLRRRDSGKLRIVNFIALSGPAGSGGRRQ